MDILLTEEEEMVRNSAREFLEGECPTSLVRAMEVDEKGYPPDLWQGMVNLGWCGLALPEKYGGQELPLAYMGLIFEEVGRAMAPVPLHCTVVASLAINRDGNEGQRQEILPRVSQGDLIMTWALTEVDPRLVPESIHMPAVADGDNYVINGAKMFVDNFNVAGKCLVACRTAPASASNEGITLFVVDTDSSGISQTPLITIAKDRQSQVVFNNVKVPKANIVGELNQGWPVVDSMLDRATALLCSIMVGGARKDAETAIEYSKNRVAFGRPIGAFQSVGHLCADMIMFTDGGELLTREAIWRMDQGLPAGIEVSQAKAFCNDRLIAVVRTGQVIHGGIGFIAEFDINLWYRRVCAGTMRLGTSFEHRAKIAKALIDKPGRVKLGSSMYDLAAA